MKAAVFHEIGSPLTIEEVPDPSPERNEVIVKVSYCGICGSDLHMTQPGALVVPSGTVLGHEFSGEVVEVGSDARGTWKKGDRVTAMPYRPCIACGTLCKDSLGVFCSKILGIGCGQLPGGYAQYIRCGTAQTLALPDTVDHQVGAMIEPLAVGCHTVRKAGDLMGADVLVMGSGPVGIAVILFARFVGARAIIAADLSAERRDRALACGASGVIDPAATPAAEEFIRQTGHAPDVIFECVGVPGLLANVIDIAPLRGRIVIAGACLKPDSFVPFTALAKELSLQFVFAYDLSDFRLVISLLEAGRVQPRGMLTDVVTFDQLPAAFEALRRPVGQCKVLLRPN